MGDQKLHPILQKRHEGRNTLMSLSTEERQAVVAFRLEKSKRALEQASGIVQMQYWETIANRLYYAAYNAVSALLIAYGHTTQTHSGVTHLFGLHFIKTGLVPTEYGRLYHKLFSMRLTGDYDDTYGISEDDVLPYIEPTRNLINTISKLAQERLSQLASDDQIK